MEIRFDISQAFNLLLGYSSTAIRYFPESKEQKEYLAKYNVPGIPITEDEMMSSLGTPVLFPIKFKGNKYKTYNAKGEVEFTEVKDFLLPFTTVATFSRAKNITKTIVNGGRSSIKEMWAFDDWQISLKGLIFKDEKFGTMKDQIDTLLQYEDLTDSIEVESRLFNIFGISRLVINSISFPESKGTGEVIGFEMSCESDDPIELIEL